MKELRAALRAVDAGHPAALVFVVDVGGSTPRSTGSRMAVLHDGSIVGTIGGGEVEHRVIALALACLKSGQPARFDAHLTRDLGMCCGGKMSVHVEPLLPSPTLHVFGAGHVAHAFAPLASALGFDLTVIDDRDELNTAERFPHRRHVGDPVRYADALQGHATSHVLIVTHDHALDLDLCRAVLTQSHGWVGMIGSRAKVAKFKVRLRAAGLTPEQLARLQAPVGLHLGAETPAEIGVSIAAQLIRHRRAITEAAVPLSMRQ